MRARRRILIAFSALLLVAAALPAAAQYASSYEAVKGMDERFQMNLGGFFQKFDTTLRLDSEQLGRGTEINLEDVFGQDSSKTSFRADGYWRFGRHGSLQLAFLTWSRSGSNTLNRDIQFGDNVFHAGVATSSKLTVTDIELYYAYSFVNTGEMEFGLMLGASTVINSGSFEASGSITGPGGTTTVATKVEDTNLVAPIPALGGLFRYTLLPRFMFVARARGLPKVTISGYSGTMFDGRAGLDYYFTKNVGIGGSYNYTRIKFAKEGSTTLQFDYRFSGPYFYIGVAF